MKAVVLGAGRIGCGLVTEALTASGHDITIGARGRVLSSLRRTGRYDVRLVDAHGSETRTVTGFDVVAMDAEDDVLAALGDADVIATAAGVDQLDSLGALIGRALANGERPVDVLAFENHTSAGPALRRILSAHVPAGRMSEVGCSGVVIDRVVAHRCVPDDPAQPMTFIGDPADRWLVDRAALRHPNLVARGMVAVDNFDAWVRRKLFTYSAGHAATAYLGSLKGFHYVHSAIRDPEIHRAVRAAMAEGQRGLADRYGRLVAGKAADLDAIIERFANAALNDPIARVGRDPRRKLGADDRLAGAAHLAASAGLDPDALATAMAAALCFCDEHDRAATTFHGEVESLGAEAVLATVSGVSATSRLGRTVLDRWRTFTDGWSAGNLLLSLEQPTWAWCVEDTTARAGTKWAA